ncbi:lamin tail domain-containing protein [Candidatus Bipolaricaulota bacterium]|nr:lamin tail domain-containing protein [Candidatus Bipolaricaulota bacterium]
MRRILAFSIVALVAVSMGVLALEWEGTDWGSEVVLNSSTGLPAIVFHATIEYSETPTSYDFEGGWEAYQIVGSTRVPLDIAPTSTFLHGDTLAIYTTTSQIPIQTGKQYGATLALHDTVNGLFFEHTYTYTAGDLLPYGISLRGWDGSIEDIDLGNLPDEELEELALLYDQLKRWATSPEDQTVEAFLRGDAAARPDTAILRGQEEQEIDRCTYSACGAACCSTCAEHVEDEEAQPTEGTEEPTPDVRIECIVYEGAPFEEDGNEYVELKNYGDLEQDLLGWTLGKKSDRNHIFTFIESFMLEPGMSVRIYTNEAYADSNGFSFGLEESLWTNVLEYPISLILVPLAPEISAPSGFHFTFTVALTLTIYTLASPSDINYILGQIAQFNQDYDGRIYVGSGSSIAGGAKTIFMHNAAWQVLEAASNEMRNR